MEITINTTREDNIGQQLINIKGFLNDTNDIDFKELVLNFKNFKYSPPLLAVFFAAFSENLEENNIINERPNSYLDSIYFPNGLNPDKIENWEERLNSYINKSYLPLIHFSTSTIEELAQQRNNVISCACRMIRDITNIPTNYYSGISYLISEITDNIVDHSRQDRGWISFQHYPANGYLDLCLADSGRGLLKSYQEYRGENDYSHINTHIDALDNAIKGYSTKHLKERGFGVHTSREMLIKGLKGTFVMISGNAIMANYKLTDFQCFYEGTLIMIRIPSQEPDSNFNVINYVE